MCSQMVLSVSGQSASRCSGRRAEGENAGMKHSERCTRLPTAPRSTSSNGSRTMSPGRRVPGALSSVTLQPVRTPGATVPPDPGLRGVQHGSARSRQSPRAPGVTCASRRRSRTSTGSSIRPRHSSRAAGVHLRTQPRRPHHDDLRCSAGPDITGQVASRAGAGQRTARTARQSSPWPTCSVASLRDHPADRTRRRRCQPRPAVVAAYKADPLVHTTRIDRPGQTDVRGDGRTHGADHLPGSAAHHPRHVRPAHRAGREQDVREQRHGDVTLIEYDGMYPRTAQRARAARVFETSWRGWSHDSRRFPRCPGGTARRAGRGP